MSFVSSHKNVSTKYQTFSRRKFLFNSSQELCKLASFLDPQDICFLKHNSTWKRKRKKKLTRDFYEWKLHIHVLTSYGEHRLADEDDDFDDVFYTRAPTTACNILHFRTTTKHVFFKCVTTQGCMRDTSWTKLSQTTFDTLLRNWF